ncbi:MAG: hypothetical protein AAF598_07160 [Bacteroidota bacterium]
MKNYLISLVLILAGGVLLGTSFIGGSGGGKGDLDIEIQKTAFIMPAAHGVYSNPEALNGKYYLFKAKLTNTSSAKMEDITVKYQIPGYIEWTELDVIGEMFPGQSAVVVCYPKFKEDITSKTTESTEKVEIEISWDGADEDDIIEEDFAFKLTDVNKYVFTNVPSEEILGWSDVFSNDELLACFVTPNDPIVGYYTQILQEKVLEGEAASVSKNPKEAVRFLAGIYEATLMQEMVYSGTAGIPNALDDVQSFSQQNRLPREVITGNTGLCLELSLLYASILSRAGIDPLIFLVPGHAYPGFRMNGEIYAIESTGIGGAGLGGISDVQAAFQKGMNQLDTFIMMNQAGDPRFTVVDVHALNADGAVPMALKDNAFMRKKVDDMAEKFENFSKVSKPQPKKKRDTNRPRPTPKPKPNPEPERAKESRTAGPLSVVIPSGWQYLNRPYPEVPIVTGTVVSPDQQSNAMIYDIQAYDLYEAMGVIEEYLYYLGSTTTYSINGNSITGQTFSSLGTFVWKAKARKTNSGYRIVAVGSNQVTYNQMSSTLTKMYNSIR